MYENHKFFYRVIYTHLSDDEYNEKNFRNADLLIARENALVFLATLSKELSEISNLEYSLQLEFNYELFGALHKYTLIEDELDEEELMEGREFEKDVYLKLGLDEPE